MSRNGQHGTSSTNFKIDYNDMRRTSRDKAAAPSRFQPELVFYKESRLMATGPMRNGAVLWLVHRDSARVVHQWKYLASTSNAQNHATSGSGLSRQELGNFDCANRGGYVGRHHPKQG